MGNSLANAAKPWKKEINEKPVKNILDDDDNNKNNNRKITRK